MKNELLYTINELWGAFASGVVLTLFVCVMMIHFVPFFFQKLADNQDNC